MAFLGECEDKGRLFKASKVVRIEHTAVDIESVLIRTSSSVPKRQEGDLSSSLDIHLSGQEDILQQISNDLELSEFSEEDFKISPGPDDLMSGLHHQQEAEEHSLFADVLKENHHNSSSLMDSSFMDDPTGTYGGVDGRLSSSNPVVAGQNPPSPTNSDSADSGISSNGSHHHVQYHPPRSPQQFQGSPPQIEPSSSSVFLLNETPSKMQFPQSTTSHSPEIITLSDISNLKIQIPKINRPSVPQSSIPNNIASLPNLVLTTEQLARLTESGVLKASHPQTTTSLTTTTNKNVPLVIKTEPVVVPSNYSVTSASSESLDVKALKRQQRMIKNRESACLSRKKKKEYVTNLEEKFNALCHENELIKKENETLRERIRALEAEKILWKEGIFGSSSSYKSKSPVVLFVVLFVFGLNFVSTRNNLFKSSSSLSPHASKVSSSSLPILSQFNGLSRSGRNLLWFTETSSSDDDSAQGLHFNQSIHGNISSICQNSYLNKSESIRLENQLRGWFVDDQNLFSLHNSNPKGVREKGYNYNYRGVGGSAPGMGRKSSRRGPKKNLMSQETQVSYFSSNLFKSLGKAYKSWFLEGGKKKGTNLHGGASSASRKVGVFNQLSRSQFDSLFKAIHRRDDTFYVVSFSEDHFLLPAAAQNQSSRPIMSLLLPSSTPKNNSKDGNDDVSMMQIDCAVMNTRLVKLNPESLSKGGTRRSGEGGGDKKEQLTRKRRKK